MTVTVETPSRQKLRILLSTCVKKFTISSPHARVPLHMISGAWSCLVLDLFELVKLFPNQEFGSIYSVELTPSCTILRMFSLFKCPLPTIELFSELDQNDIQRNPRLPKPPFSKRQHEPLDERLCNIPMHIQIVDEFYCSLFRPNRKHDDICLREFNDIVEIRKLWLENFNQYDNYEQNAVKITKTERLDVQEPTQDTMDSYQQRATELAHQKATEVKRPAPRAVGQNLRAQQRTTRVTAPRQKAGDEDVSATLAELKRQQKEAEETKRMIDMQINAINTRNLNEDFAKEQAAKREQNLKNLR